MNDAINKMLFLIAIPFMILAQLIALLFMAFENEPCDACGVKGCLKDI
jgi:hypothetical protein